MASFFDQINCSFIKWTRIIYKAGLVKSSVIVNGFISKPFFITKGIRQGYPLPACLYVLASEAFCNNIRANPNIKGISVGTRECKISNYADDTNFFVQDFILVDEIFATFDLFHKISGATLNEDKTNILLLNGLSERKPPDKYKKFVTTELKIYGFYFDKKGFAVETSF